MWVARAGARLIVIAVIVFAVAAAAAAALALVHDRVALGSALDAARADVGFFREGV